MQRIPWWDRACDELKARDPVMTALVDRHRSERLRGSGDAFRTLINAIVGQQISVAAADAVWSRLTAAYAELTPESLAMANVIDLRAVGLSNQKAISVCGIAQAFVEGAVDPASWQDKSDADVRAELTALRGVGPWTADMVLIFHLHRPDVLPLGDIGLVNAAARLYRFDQNNFDHNSFDQNRSDHAPSRDDAASSGSPAAKRAVSRARLETRKAWLREQADRWRPWRTVATWYIWRDLDVEPVVY